MPELQDNVFFDINQLPQEKGLLVFGISMSRISNAQNAERYFEFLEHVATKIKKTEGIGALFCYGDYLYFLSDDPARELRTKFLSLMFQHRNGFMKIIKKHVEWIPKAFSFLTFGQALLDNSREFAVAFSKIQEFHRNDAEFQEHVSRDCVRSGKGTDEGKRQFFLEEITFFYLASKGRLQLRNDFIRGHEEWILHCYPGKPLESEVYLYQTNPLKFSNPRNKYENCYYDLESKKLFDYMRIDLTTFDFSD